MPTPQRLPIVNADDGVWGDIIRQYLMKEHYDDGTDNAVNGGHQKITVRAGSATAGTAPIKLTSGTLMTTPEAGAIEFNGDAVYFTQTTGPTRKKFAIYDDASGATGDIYYRNSSGLLTRLGSGATGTILTIASGIPSWASAIVGTSIDNTSTVTLKDTSFTLQDATDTTKQVRLDVAAAQTTGTTRTITLPTVDSTLATLAGTETLTGKTLTSPKVNQVLDTNGNTAILVGAVTSAVNYVQIANAATTGIPTIEAKGTDTNIGVSVVPKGTGALSMYMGTGQTVAQVAVNGSATNVDLNLTTQGSGVVKANNIEVDTISGTQTLTNKTISGTTNTLTNVTGMVVPVVCATQGSETYAIASGSVTQINGTVIDGYSPAVNDRILVTMAPATTGAGTAYSLTTQPTNGIYVVTSNTTNLSLTRASDFSGTVHPAGIAVYVQNGSAFGNSLWRVTAPNNRTNAFIYGTTSMYWASLIGNDPGFNSIYLWNGTYNSHLIPSPSLTAAQTLTLPATTTDTIVGRASVDTLTNKTLTTPKMTTVFDSNGATALNFSATASAVNYPQFISGATGIPVALQAAGTDTNVGLNLKSKGTGIVYANGLEVTTISGAQTLTGKTLATPVLNGIPTGTGVATTTTANTLALRDGNANLLADAFIPGLTSTATAAGTTTLTVDSTQIQVFTGSTTQTVSLPTSGVTAGQQYTIINRSTGFVYVQSSNGNAIVTISSTWTATFIAVVATPTAFADWTTNQHPGTGGWADTQPSAYTISQRTSEGNLLADAFIPSATSTVTAGGTTTLTVDSTEVQIFTGSSTQTVTMPTTNIVAGQRYQIHNQATTNLTINASGGGTIGFYGQGVSLVLTALTATPTTAAGWSTNQYLPGTAFLSSTATGSSVALRNSQANILADAFVPSATTTATAAGTTTLTSDSTQVQVFTGSTTQNCDLPTTSITIGMSYTVINQSSGTVTVRSSAAGTVAALAQNNSCTFIANTATPTTAADWTQVGFAAKTASRLLGTDSGSLPTSLFYDSAPNSAGTIALRDTTSSLQAKGFIPSSTSTPTAAGTTALAATSSSLQIFTGTTTQIVTLATTSVIAGHNFTILNQSTGIVTVNSSAGNFVQAVSPNSYITVTALQATPTTAAHWFTTLDFNTGTSNNTVAKRDGTGKLNARNFVSATTSTATAAGTTTLVTGDSAIQIFTGTTTQTVLLPTTSVAIGQQYTIINGSTGAVTVQSSGANTISTMAANTTATFTALVSTPTTAANWSSSYVTAGGGSTTFSDSVFTIQDDGDATKQAKFELSGITTGTTRTYTLPNANVTLASDSTVVHTTGNETVAGNKSFTGQNNFTQLLYTKEVYIEPTGGAGNTAAFTLDNDNGQIYNVTNNSGGSFAITDATNSKNPLSIQSNAQNNSLLINGSGAVVKDNYFVIQDDSDNTKQAKFEASGITTATTRTYTVPNASGTLALTSDIAAARTVVNVLDYGAVGNNSTDNTSAIAAAQAAVGSYGVVWFPAGTYRHTGITATAGVQLRGVGRGKTILRNTHATNTSVSMSGTPGGPYLPGASVEAMTIDATALRSGQIGIQLLLAQAVRVADVEIMTHGIGVQHQASWENLYQDVHVHNCTTGWYIPVPGAYTSSCPVAMVNCHAVDCTTGFQVDDGIQALTWVGGDFSRCTNGVILDGNQTGQITFQGINFEGISGDDVKIGSASYGPAAIKFIGCRFFWSSTTKTRSVYFQRGDQLVFDTCRWTNSVLIARQDSSTGSMTMIGCQSIGQTHFIDLNGTYGENISPVVVSSSGTGISSVGPSGDGKTSTLAASQWLASKVLYGVGKTTVVDADFTTTPVEGAIAGVYNTTDSTFRLAARHFGAWVTMQANSANLDGWATKTAPSGAVVGTSDTQTLTNKTIVLPGTASPTYTQGKLVYDTDNESLTFYSNDSNVALQVGQEEWLRVINNSGATITNGAPVYLNGASGGYPTIALAKADAGATTIGAGLTTESIANGAIGIVTTIGIVRGLDTSAFTAGQTVYISASTAGALTATAPTAPNYRYRVGIVGVSSATVGTIHVTPSTAALGNGTANQIAGINNAGTLQEMKSVVGTTNNISVVHSANTITLDVGSNISTASSTQTFTNKTISGASNTLSNIGIASISATGTPSSTTYLRGDGTWSTPAGSGTGIVRSVATITTTTTLGATAATDYVAFIGAGGVPTLPTAVGNTNLYTVKNTDTANKTLATTSSQTVDGSTTITITPNTSISVVSDGSNWRIV